jgi:hypothetical protein
MSVVAWAHTTPPQISSAAALRAAAKGVARLERRVERTPV